MKEELLVSHTSDDSSQPISFCSEFSSTLLVPFAVLGTPMKSLFWYHSQLLTMETDIIAYRTVLYRTVPLSGNKPLQSFCIHILYNNFVGVFFMTLCCLINPHLQWRTNDTAYSASSGRVFQGLQKCRQSHVFPLSLSHKKPLCLLFFLFP